MMLKNKDNNINVSNELLKKNQEIYNKKVENDLLNQFENLQIIFKNYFESMYVDITNNILEIEKTSLNKESILSSLLLLKNELLERLIMQLEERIINLKKIIDMSYDMQQKKITENKEKIIGKFIVYYEKKVNVLIKKISENYTEFEKNRLNTYLLSNVSLKLKNKLYDILSLYDGILFNSLNEDRRKLELMNSVTKM